MSSGDLFTKLKERMQQLGVEPKRSLGQNFLISPDVVEKIILCAQKFQADSIIEVGPGLGTLTDLLRQIREKPVLIEMDHKLAQFWKDQGLEVIQDDALKISWSTLPVSGKTLLVSNLPYQISSSLVVERSIDEHPLDGMILMFQKEVAQRILASPKSGDYGLLSVIAQMTWEIRKVADASPRDFFPPPNVASRVLFFQRKASLPERRSEILSLVKASFSHRRKKLFNNLLGSGRPPQRLESAWAALAWSENVRAEELSVANYIDLFRQLH